MKKQTRIFLSVILILSMLASIFSIAIAVTPTTPGTILGWTVYDNSTTKIGTGGQLTYGNVPVEDDTTTVYTGAGADSDSKSTKVTNGYAQYVTAKIAVEQNKRYELTGYYKTDTLNASQAVFSHAIVIKDGGAKFDDSISYMDASSAYCVGASGVKTTLTGVNTVSGVQKDAWNKITLSFYSGDLTEVLMSLRPTNNTNTTVYFDGFSLKEVTALPGDVGYISGWTVYDNSTAKIGTGGQLTYSTVPVVEDATTVYTGTDADNDGKSMKVTNGYAQYVTAKVSTEKNKCYELTGYYKTDTLNASQAVFSHAIVIKDGGAKFGDSISYMDASSAYYYGTSGNKITLSNINTVSGVQKDVWNKITLSFYSGDLTEVLMSFRPTNNTNTTVYFDGFALKEIDSLPGDNGGEEDIAANWKVYNMGSTTLGTGGSVHPTATVTSTTEKVYTGEGADADGKALKFSGDTYAQYAGMEMALEANTYYELTAYYYTDKVLANAVFSHIRMVKDGGANGELSADNMGQIARDSDAYYINKNSAKYVLTGVRTTGAQAGQWNKVTLSFYSGSNTKGVLVMRPAVDTNTVTYVDGITLTKVSTLPGADYVETGWTIYDNATTKLGTGGTLRSGATVTYDTDTVYTGTDGDGDGKSYRFTGCFAQYATRKLTGLKANSYYTLTAYYYGTELDAASGMLSHARVTKDGGANAERSTDNLGAVARTYSYYTNKNGVAVNLDETTTGNVKVNQWNKITVSFYTGASTEALAVFRPTVNADIYIDGISLKEIDELAGADRVPTGWTTYTMESEKIGSGGAIHNSATVDYTTKQIYTGKGADSDGKAYLLDPNCYAQYVTRKLDMKPNTYYNLTFYYYGTIQGGNNAILGETFVVKDGATTSVETASADNLGFLSRNTSYYTNQHGTTVSNYDAKLLSEAETHQWNQVVIPFYSGDQTSALLAIRPVSPAEGNAATGSPVYIDAITLTETTADAFAFNDKKPFEGWGGPQSEYVINFDDFYVPMDMTDRIQLTDAPEKDGKVTTAAHILQGSYQSATVPNISAIGADQDPVFTVPVEENTKYSISYSLYITEGQPVLRYFAFYYDFFYTHIGNEDTTTIIRNSGMSERGEWVTFETFFTTKPGQSVCSLAWNAGEFTVDMYIDDIILRKVQPGAIADASDTSYCEEFYNELIDLDILDDIAAAKSGVYKIPVNKGVSYILGLSAQRAAGSNSRIFVSFDGVEPMEPGMLGAPNGEILPGTTMQRYGLDFMTDDSGYIYLVIENGDGTLRIEDPTLFFAYNTSKNDNKGTLTDPNFTFVTHSGALKELWVPGSNDDSFAGQMSGATSSPETGSAPIWPISAAALTLALVCCVCFVLRKGGKRA